MLKQKLTLMHYANKAKGNNTRKSSYRKKSYYSYRIVICKHPSRKNPMTVSLWPVISPWQIRKWRPYLSDFLKAHQCTSSLARWKGHKKHEVIMEELGERNIWKRHHNSMGNLASIARLLMQQLIILGDIGLAWETLAGVFSFSKRW